MEIEIKVNEDIEEEVMEATNEICNALIPLLTSLLIEPPVKGNLKPEKSSKKLKKVELDNFCLQSKIPGSSKSNDYTDAISDVLNRIQRTSISGSKGSKSHGGFINRSSSDDDGEKLKKLIYNAISQNNHDIMMIRDNLRRMSPESMQATVNTALAKQRCFKH